MKTIEIDAKTIEPSAPKWLPGEILSAPKLALKISDLREQLLNPWHFKRKNIN